MSPAKLSIRDSIVSRKPIGDDHLMATGIFAQQGFQTVMPARAMDAEGRDFIGDPDPEPGLLAGLSPAGFIDMNRVSLSDSLEEFGHRLGQNLTGLTLELGDHAGGDREAQQVGEEPLDLPFAQAIGPAQKAGPGLKPRSESSSRNIAGELGSIGGPAPRAGEAMQAILDDLGADLGKFGDLMAERLGILSVESVAASGTGRRLDLDSPGQLLDGNQLASLTLMARLSAPPLLGSRLGRLSLDVERLGGGRLGRVRGVLVDPSLEGGDPRLE
jgi:hypothetical protein